MAERLPPDNKKTGALLRGVVGATISLVGYLAVGAFMTYSLAMVQELIHALGHSKLPLSWLGLALADGSPLPLGLPLVVIVPAALMQISALVCGRPARIPLWLMPTALGVVLAVLAGVWALEGGHLAQGIRDGRVYHLYASVSIDLAATMTGSLILIGRARLRGRPLGWLGVMGPLACIVLGWVLMVIEPVWINTEDVFPSLTSPSYLVATLLIVAAVVAVSAWIERRLRGRLDRTLFLASALLWATAAIRALVSVAAFGHMCSKASNPVGDACEIGLRTILVLEVIGIALLTFLRSRAAKARQESGADSSAPASPSQDRPTAGDDKSQATGAAPSENPSRGRRVRRRRYWLLALVGLLGVGWAIWLSWGPLGWRQVNELVADIRAGGEPVDWKDFAAPSIPDEDNAAPLFMQAGKTFDLPFNTEYPHETEADRLRGMLRDLVANRQFRAQHRAGVKKMRELSAESLALLRQGSARVGMDWKMDFTGPAAETKMPHIGAAVDLSLAAALEALEAHSAGDEAETFRRLSDVLALARAIGRVPITVAVHLQIANHELVVTVIEEILPTIRIGPPPGASPQQVRNLMAQLLEGDARQENLVRSLMADRCLVLDTFQRWRNGEARPFMLSDIPPDWARPQFLPWDCLVMMRAMTTCAEAARQKTCPEALTKWGQNPYDLDTMRLSTSKDPVWFGQHHMVSHFLRQRWELGVWRESLLHFFKLFARGRMAGLALAMRLYEVEKGRPPATLGDLVTGGYLKAIPDDFFGPGGAKICYQNAPPSPLLYSVGENGQDDGGSFTADPEGGVKSDDILFFLNGDRPVDKVQWRDPKEPLPQSLPKDLLPTRPSH